MTLHEKAQKIKAIALDIDGVQTDGTIGFGAGSDEIKFFYARDGHGITMAKRAGIVFAVLSGRKAMCNRTRMEAMGFSVILEGCLDKKEGFTELAEKLGLSKEEILYIGDDIVDAWPVKEAGLGFIVADAVPELDAVADLRLTKVGGRGAVREAIEWLLKEQGKWDSLMTRYFG